MRPVHSPDANASALSPHVEPARGPVVRRAIDVTGIVQGVGFRPFVHGLAHELGHGGFVKNVAGGTVIEVEGDVVALERFVRALQTDRPLPARIDALRTRSCAPCGDDAFRIEQSEAGAPGHVAIAADLATCDDCLRELFDPDDRRSVPYSEELT